MKRPLRWYDLLTVNIFFLGLTAMSQTNGLVQPLLVQQFVGDAAKGSAYGTLRLWSLMTALLLQAVMGMLSDRSTLPLGRRRPFIFLGTIGSLFVITMIGLSANFEGDTGFWFLFSMTILLAVVANMAQAAQQGLIPDLVPEQKRGLYSGVKAILEVPLPMILVAFTIARLIARGQMWNGLFLLMGILVIAMVIAMFVPEKRQEKAPGPFNWRPLLRLLAMAGGFTAIILGLGQIINWIGGALAQVDSVNLRVAVMGIAGLTAMLIAIALGVWVSVRISVGRVAAEQRPAFTWWVINRLAFLVGAFNLSTFAVYFIQARLGYVREQAAGPASLLMTVVGVFILVSALPSGWLADKFGRKPLIALAGILGAAGVMIALSVPSLTIIYIGGCLIGIGTGFFYAANWALGTELVPREEAGRYLGISNLAGAGAGAVGAYIGGPIADYFTVAVPEVQGLGYVLLFGIYGTLFLLSVGALAFIKEVRAPKGLASATVPEGAGD
jgi:MFS family permease